MTREHTSGNVIPQGKLTLKVGAGIVILDDILSEDVGKEIVMNSDFESAGDGTLTVWSGKTVKSNNGDITLTVWDIDITGTVDAGYKGLTFHGSKVDQTIGIGNSGQLDLSDSEVGRITSTDGLTIGSSTNGQVVVSGITDSSSDMVGRITIRAIAANSNITFSGIDSSFNKGITVQAMSGTILSQSVTTKNTNTVVSAGTATLTIMATKAISTTSQHFVMSTDDIDLQGTVDTGAASGVLTTFTSQTIGIGGANDTDTPLGNTHMDVEALELQRITATGLTIGSLGVNKGITVNGISSDNSNGITTIMTMLASVDDSQVIFETNPSTFYALAVQADRGVLVMTDVSTSIHSMYLDGDMEDNKTDDENPNTALGNTVHLGANLIITAKTVMTLESSTSMIVPAGDGTFQAGSGIIFMDHLLDVAQNKTVVINADYESTGDGTLTVVASRTVDANNGKIQITAWDFDLLGSMTAGTSEISIHGAHPDQTIGIGATPQNMHITNEEMGRITALGNMRVGSSMSGNMFVSGIDELNSDKFSRLTLVATRAGRTITSHIQSSSFNKGITMVSAVRTSS